MSFFKFVLSLLVSFVIPSVALANPVSFKEGWGIMPAFTPDWSDVDVNYSVTSKDAIGISNFHRVGSSSTADFGIVRFNRLIKRWNELESQANIYASAGIGGREDSEHGDALAGYGAFEVDYETRRIYTLFGAESLKSERGVEFNRLRGRIGLAPYKAPIDELQTWIVAQVDYMPEMDEETEITPLLRFFYNNLALEVGISLKGNTYLAAMAHF